MIASKKIKIIVAVLTCFSLLFCGFIVYAANTFDTTKITEYQKKMFGDKVITIDIRVDPDEWHSVVIDRATQKEWISADLVIDGVTFDSVGIRTKGNSSLSMNRSGSDGGRYSLQFKANKYVKGQTFYGLDTFCVNNMTGDATYMKDFLAYDVMNFIGVDTPLYNFANVTVNGEHYGFGITLERYDQSYLDRVYGATAGELYNVKISMGMRGDFEGIRQEGVFDEMPGRNRQGGGRSREFTMPEEFEMPDGFEVPEGFFVGRMFNEEMSEGVMNFGGFGGGGGMFGRDAGGGSLVYTDSEISSYSQIFNNAVFNPSDSDKKRVITALDNLNNGDSDRLEKYINVDATLRYFAAHTFMVNGDSYTSNMAQNYYLYERDGKLTILPWDYNLSLGGYQSNNATNTVNFPIDTPVSGVSMEDRPLLSKLLEVDEYRERYHQYLRQIAEEYDFNGVIKTVDEKINSFVKNDSTSFFTYEQYENSLPVLTEVLSLRAKSISGQLNGVIPSTSSGQNADNGALINASHINLSVMGSMGMGNGNIIRGNRDDRQQQAIGEAVIEVEAAFAGVAGGRQMPEGAEFTRPEDGVFTDRSEMPEGGFGGERSGRPDFITDGEFVMPEGFEPPEGGFPFMNEQEAAPAEPPEQSEQNINRENFQPPSGMGNTQQTPQSENDYTNIIVNIACVVLLIGAIIFVAVPRKNQLH